MHIWGATEVVLIISPCQWYVQLRCWKGLCGWRECGDGLCMWKVLMWRNVMPSPHRLKILKNLWLYILMFLNVLNILKVTRTIMRIIGLSLRDLLNIDSEFLWSSAGASSENVTLFLGFARSYCFCPWKITSLLYMTENGPGVRGCKI